MTTMMKMLAGTAGLAAIAAAAPAAAQYGYSNPYGYAYGQQYGYGYNQQAQMTQMATQRCAAAVQSRLAQRTSSGGGIIGAILGVNTRSQGRVLSVTQVNPNRSTIRVRGLATSGRVAYNPYGVGAYGAVGMGYQPDLTFKCDVDYRGYIRDVDINRR